MGEITEMKFSKCLVGKHSPQNQCHANDGEQVLPMIFKGSKKKKFFGVESGKLSEYGWVKALDKEFTEDEFRESIRKNSGIEIDETHYSVIDFLKQVNKYAADTPMAFGVFDKISNNYDRAKYYKTFKVIFYEAKK